MRERVAERDRVADPDRPEELPERDRVADPDRPEELPERPDPFAPLRAARERLDDPEPFRDELARLGARARVEPDPFPRPDDPWLRLEEDWPRLEPWLRPDDLWPRLGDFLLALEAARLRAER